MNETDKEMFHLSLPIVNVAPKDKITTDIIRECQHIFPEAWYEIYYLRHRKRNELMCIITTLSAIKSLACVSTLPKQVHSR